jgi:hypothetical protein
MTSRARALFLVRFEVTNSRGERTRLIDMVRLVLVIAVAACRSAGDVPSPTMVSSAPASVPVDASIAPDAADPAADDFSADAPIVAAPLLPPDDPFRAAVRMFAKSHHRMISAWGTLHLGGTDKPYRFATLSVQVDVDGNVLAGSAHDGAYIIEESPIRYWLVTHWWNAASFHGQDAPPSAEPPWVVLDDRWIRHSQMHNHGKANISFGLRGGVLVDLQDDDYNSRLDDDAVQHVYSNDGVCATPCPPLAKAKLRGFDLPVSGPANRIDLLVEPPTLF